MTKIEALRKTVENLETNKYMYDWSSSDSCNCGILARTVLNGKSPYTAGFTDTPTASKQGVFASYAYCMTTDLDIPEVFKALKDAGFTYQDMVHLEYLSDEKIADRAGLKVVTKDNWREEDPTRYEGMSEFTKRYCKQFGIKYYVIAYMKAWIEILEEEAIEQKEETKHIDITKELASLSIVEEVADTKKQLVNV